MKPVSKAKTTRKVATRSWKNARRAFVESKRRRIDRTSMHDCLQIARLNFLALILIVAITPGIAQVKIEETVKKPAKPSAPATAPSQVKKPPAPPANSAAVSKQPCQKTPAGCSTTFTPVAAYVAPGWYASQENNQKEAAKSQQKAIAYLEKYKAYAIKRGWEMNDIARSYAFFVSLTYNVYSQGKGPDQAQMEKLARRFRQ